MRQLKIDATTGKRVFHLDLQQIEVIKTANIYAIIFEYNLFLISAVTYLGLPPRTHVPDTNSPQEGSFRPLVLHRSFYG